MDRQDIIRALRDLGVDSRFVTIREDAVLINNAGLARFSAKWQRSFEEETGLRVARSRTFMAICQKVSRTISRHRMLKPRDTVLVALSGGKDSLILLNALEPYRRKYGIELVAATVDLKVGHQTPWREGSRGLEITRRQCRVLGIEHHHLKTGYDSLKVTEELNELARKGHRYNPCFTCSHIRRSLLTHLAEELGASSIAFAHTLDDDSDTILASLIKGEKVKPLEPVKTFGEGFIQLKKDRIVLRPTRIIRPLIEVPESIIIRALRELQIEYYDDKKKCIYSREWGDSIRKKAHAIIQDLEREVPNVREMIAASARK
jgi:tRNA(Ile)-lysidine synthase TilS/MesJ